MSFSDDDLRKIADVNALIGQRIGNIINAGLEELGLKSVKFSDELLEVLRRAWVLASELQSKSVTVDHVVVAAHVSDPTIRRELEAVCGGHPLVQKAGALINIAALKEAAHVQSLDQLKPVTPVLRWIAAAAACDSSENGLSTIGLIQVLANPAGNTAARQVVRDALKEQIEIEDTKGQFVRLHQDTRSLSRTIGQYRFEAERLTTIVTDLTTGIMSQGQALDTTLSLVREEVGKPAAALTAIGDQLNELHSSSRTQHDQQVKGMAAVAAEQAAALQGLGASLTTLDSRLKRIEIPSPPPGAHAPTLSIRKLAALTAGVVALGVVLGFTVAGLSSPVQTAAMTRTASK